MNNWEKLHEQIVERIEYITLNCEDLDVDEKLAQLKMIFADIGKQKDKDLFAEELFILIYYTIDDDDANLHFQITLNKKEGDSEHDNG